MKTYIVYIKFNDEKNMEILYKTEVVAHNSTIAISNGMNTFFAKHPIELHGNIVKTRAALKG